MPLAKIKKSDAEWEKVLSPAAYKIMRLKETEVARTGAYFEMSPTQGYFACNGCGLPIYSFKHKIRNPRGWAAFNGCFTSKNGGCHLEYKEDIRENTNRVALTCCRCDGHIGFIEFEGWGLKPSIEKHTVNSDAIKYVDAVPGVKDASGEWGALGFCNIKILRGDAKPEEAYPVE